MIIRHGKKEDVEQLASIEAASYPAAEGASLESIKARINAYPECFWVLEDKGEIKAFINGLCTEEKDLTDHMYQDTAMHNLKGSWQMIFSVVTAPAYRKKGYAGMVMEQVIEDTRQRGKTGLVLTCKEALLPFYSKFGFKNEGISGSTHGNVLWYQMRLTFAE